MPHLLGATWDGEGTNFALFSAHATKVEVCLFDSATGKETGRVELPEYTDQVFHGYLSKVEPASFYGDRVNGPYEPEADHQLNPQ